MILKIGMRLDNILCNNISIYIFFNFRKSKNVFDEKIIWTEVENNFYSIYIFLCFENLIMIFLPLYFLLQVFIIETLNSIGIGIMVFDILPNINAVEGSIITLNVFLMPQLHLILRKDRKRWLKIIQIFLFLFHVSVIICWSVILHRSNSVHWISTILSPILISIQFWENFVDENSEENVNHGWIRKFKKSLNVIIEDLNGSNGKGESLNKRDRIMWIVSLWKIFVTFMMTILFQYINGNSDVIKDLFRVDFQIDKIKIIEENYDTSNSIIVNDNTDVHFMVLEQPHIFSYILLIQVAATTICYSFSIIFSRICVNMNQLLVSFFIYCHS